jgi:hypothetical protein
MNTSQWENELKRIYSTPGESGAFSSSLKLYKILKSKGYYITQKDVQKWLDQQYVYTIHQNRRVIFKRNPIIAQRIDHIWQADILFLPDIGSYNDRKPCSLVCIDVVSRYTWVESMRNKSGDSTAKAFENILKRTNGRKPSKLQTDKGTEFYNHKFKSMLKKYNITLYSSESDQKAAIAERVIKEIKKLIYRFMDERQTNRYIDVLQDLVKTYNHTFHSRIKMAPKDVTIDREGEVLENLYGHLWKQDTYDNKNNKPRFNTGDHVRISFARLPFTKGYKGYWSTEIFTIHTVKFHYPFKMYKLRDNANEILKGLFYEHELKLALPKSQRFTEINQILKKKS